MENVFRLHQKFWKNFHRMADHKKEQALTDIIAAEDAYFETLGIGRSQDVWDNRWNPEEESPTGYRLGDAVIFDGRAFTITKLNKATCRITDAKGDTRKVRYEAITKVSPLETKNTGPAFAVGDIVVQIDVEHSHICVVEAVQEESCDIRIVGTTRLRNKMIKNVVKVETRNDVPFRPGDIVRSQANRIAQGVHYRVIKTNKTTCWVETIDCDRFLYKNQRYSGLFLVEKEKDAR